MIIVLCPNGHRVGVPDACAGKLAVCGVCQVTMLIPGPRPAPVAHAPRPPEKRVPGPPPAPVADAPGSPAPAPMVVTVFKEPEPAPVTGIRGAEEYLEIKEFITEPDTFPVRDGDPEPPRPKKKRRGRSRARMNEEARERLAGLALVNLGLGFHYAALITWLAAIVLALVGLSVVAFGPGAFGTAHVLATLVIVLRNVIIPLLGITGSILCLWVPGESRARPFLIVSLALNALLFFLSFPFLFVALGQAADLTLAMISYLLFLTAWSMFLLFLKFLADYLDEPHMGNEAVHLLFKGIIIFVSVIFLIAVVSSLMHLSPLGFAIPALLLMGLWLIWFVNYLFEVLNLIGSLRQVIATRW